MATHTEIILHGRPPHDTARKLRWTGIAFLAIGILAVVLPALTGLTLGIILGLLLLLGGAAQLVYASQSRLHKGTKVLAGIVYLLLGILLLAYPQAGLVSLALIIGILFLLEGLLEIWYATRLRPLSSWGWVMAGGVISILLALLIWAGLPQGAAWIIGLLFGIGLIVNGIAILGLSSIVREA